MRFLMLDLSPRVPRLRLLPVALALLAWTLCQATPALKSSPLLQEQIPQATRSALPTFISGERLFGRPDLETVIEGHAELRRADLVIKADRLDYDQPTDLARAQGQVRINRAGNVYEGPLLEIKLDAFEGFFNQPRYYFLKNDSHGEASKVDFIDDQRLVIHNATLTTCRRLPGPSWMPDWILRATTLRMDNEADVGTAEGAVLSFKGVPLLPIPALSFPLSDQRKSGFLPPTLELDNVNGAVVSMPYYWNIAPNRDATFTPTLMSKRGVNIGSEFRYLEADYSGRVQFDVMPSDPLRDSSRWGLTYGHQTTLKNGLTQRLTDAGVALNLNLNRVSDDNYWRDFTRASSSLTQRLLSNDVNMSWNNGPFASSARAVKWQTLQDVTAPIAQPYDLTQLSTRYTRGNVFGADVSVVADYAQFQTDTLLSAQPNANGQRIFSLVQASHPWIAPAGFITPKVQLHAAHYQLDAPLSTGATSVGRVVPTFSVDSGLVFERDTTLFGTALRQTLEPRAFYVNTPFRDQNALPNYDSGAKDFNFATIYSENAFVGNDRISDSNLLTLGVSTRFLNPASGAEVARFGVAQRLRFTDQNITLPGGLAATDRLSDLLLGAAVNWDPRWAFNSTVQYNPSTQQSVRSTIGARYNPSHYRTVTAAYRLQRDVSEQIDVGWQWPLNDLWGDRGASLGAGRGQGEGRWYSVGRLNYSLNERKLVDAVLGLEYDAGCWLGRAVLEQLQTSTTAANQRIMFQLEFVGFTRLGVSPLKSLKDNVPNYQYLREQTSPPSRFSNYE
jgi:LPS-assembly protein